MAETEEQREARWAASRARQEAYRASPEFQVLRADRIAAGLCVFESDVCLTHNVAGGFDHYLATRPVEDRGHNPKTGIAYND